MKDTNNVTENFVDDPAYGQKVNHVNSTVHVPIDIYDKGRGLQTIGCYAGGGGSRDYVCLKIFKVILKVL